MQTSRRVFVGADLGLGVVRIVERSCGLGSFSIYSLLTNFHPYVAQDVTAMYIINYHRDTKNAVGEDKAIKTNI